MGLFKREDTENEEEIDCQNFHFEWKGKTYTSIEHLRKELSSKDLRTILTATNLEIEEYDRTLKKANFWYDFCSVIPYVGFGTLFFSGVMPPMLKTVAEIFSPVVITASLVAKLFNFKKYLPVESEQEELIFLSEEIDEELSIRQAQNDYNKKCENVFSDIYLGEKE